MTLPVLFVKMLPYYVSFLSHFLNFYLYDCSNTFWSLSCVMSAEQVYFSLNCVTLFCWAKESYPTMCDTVWRTHVCEPVSSLPIMKWRSTVMLHLLFLCYWIAFTADLHLHIYLILFGGSDQLCFLHESKFQTLKPGTAPEGLWPQLTMEYSWCKQQAISAIQMYTQGQHRITSCIHRGSPR